MVHQDVYYQQELLSEYFNRRDKMWEEWKVENQEIGTNSLNPLKARQMGYDGFRDWR